MYIFFLNFINSAEVAKHLNEDSCGLIFGVNTFIALVLQSLLTVIVVDERALGLATRTQVSRVVCEYLVFWKVRNETLQKNNDNVRPYYWSVTE
jgi:hypothetical protein